MLRIIILATVAVLTPTISGIAVQTNAAMDIAMRAPEPTAAPDINLAKRGRKLVRRDDGPICGYVDGDKDIPVGCNDGYQCFYWPVIPLLESASLIASQGAANCIPADFSASGAVLSDWYPATTCLDYDDGKYNTDKESAKLSQTLFCGSGATKCAELYFPAAPASFFAESGFPMSSSLAAQDYTQAYCDSKATTYTVYPTPT